MAQDEPQLSYLFDEDALEMCLCEGTPAHHDAIESCSNARLQITKRVRDNFLDAFPHDTNRIGSNFTTLRVKAEDQLIAAGFSDRLHNFDVDNPDIQDKIYFLAVAYRSGKTVVSGEVFSTTTQLKILADALDIPCIDTDQFVALHTP